MGLENEEGSTEKASVASSKACCAWLSRGLPALAKKTQRKAAEHSCCGDSPTDPSGPGRGQTCGYGPDPLLQGHLRAPRKWLLSFLL